MADIRAEESEWDDILAKIREGLTEGIRREVERCRRLGIPLVVARNGSIEVIDSGRSDQSE